VVAFISWLHFRILFTSAANLFMRPCASFVDRSDSSSSSSLHTMRGSFGGNLYSSYLFWLSSCRILSCVLLFCLAKLCVVVWLVSTCLASSCVCRVLSCVVLSLCCFVLSCQPGSGLGSGLASGYGVDPFLLQPLIHLLSSQHGLRHLL
jgi:hypothetical protein